MRKNIPASLVLPGHDHFARLDAIRSELLQRAGGQAVIEREIPLMLRDSIDTVIQTPRTGRRSYDELEKTEKTYIGTRVEIMIRAFFKLPKGKLDLEILGADADVKFTTKNNWMMPQEVIGHPCLLLAADEVTAKCYFGLFVADESYLTASGNQDKKKQVSALGFSHILWILNGVDYPPNFWRTIPATAVESIIAGKTGNQRVMTLFREVRQRAISRDVIEATAQQKDFMRRIRGDNGKGTRDLLARDGILLLSGTYDARLIQALGLGIVGPSEFISHIPCSDAERAIAIQHGIHLGSPL